MAKKWFVDPETVRITLPNSDGEWIEVKKRLTVGESRKAMGQLITEVRGDGRLTPNFEMVGKSETLAYLVDWSLTNNGKRVPIDSDAQKLAAIDNMAPDAFEVISKAVAAHVEAMDAERESEKNAQDGATASSAISPSAA